MAKRTHAIPKIPPAAWRELVPHLVEGLLLRTMRIDSAGSEANIPQRGTLITVFAPHTGWLESIVIDTYFIRVGRKRPFWLTKAENRALPRLLAADRLVCVDGQRPEPSAIKVVYQLLALPDTSLASSIEGTVFGNPLNLEDRITLTKFRTGMVRFALRTQVPILPVVVLGAESVVPELEKTWQEQGMLAAYREVQQLTAHPQPIQVRFLPLYMEHLQDSSTTGTKTIREKAEHHTTRLRDILITGIRELVPGYPVVI